MTSQDACTIERLLYPNPQILRHLAAGVAAALGKVRSVRRIALFGSLAEDRADCWSDIDMFVGCEDVAATQWSAAAAIRTARPVLFYQTFSTAEQPSGRYWFVGESPFHKLDITFLSREEYETRRGDMTLNGYPIAVRNIYTARADDVPAASPPVPLTILQFGEHEIRIQRIIAPLMNSLHSRLRGREMYPNSSGELDLKARMLRESLNGVTRDTVMAGGRIGLLAWQLLEMAECLLQRGDVTCRKVVAPL